MSAAPKTTPNNPLTDKNLVNAFLASVEKTLRTMASTPVTPEKAFVETTVSTKGEVSGLIGMVAGGMKGTLSLTFEKGTIFHVLKNMLGEEHNTLGSEVADAVGELTNMIYGDAKTTLNQKGYSFEAAIPTVIMGPHTIHSYHHGATLVVPFKCDGGKLFVEITVQV